MRIESSVTSVSWIPSEAMPGMMKMPMELGISHYDDPLPEKIDDLEELRAHDRFRFANVLRAYIEVDDFGRVVDHGHLGDGMIGSTTLRLGTKQLTIAAVPFETLRPEVEVGEGWARFRQTAGGRTGAPLPRRTSRPPYFQITAPTAWTTLSLTLHADGRSEFEVVGASRFPRHWIYDHDGELVQKSGTIDFKDWADQYGVQTPWGETDSPALVTAVESALERELSMTIMRGGAKPSIRKVAEGETLVREGEEGSELFLLLDGVLEVTVGDRRLGDIGPGAIVGERAIVEGGVRTSTLTALTPAKVAVATADQVDRAALVELAQRHRREEEPAAS